MDRITRAKSERVRIVSRTHACTHHGQSVESRSSNWIAQSLNSLDGWMMALVIKVCLGLFYWLWYIFVFDVSGCLSLRYNFWHCNDWTRFKTTTLQVNSINVIVTTTDVLFKTFRNSYNIFIFSKTTFKFIVVVATWLRSLVITAVQSEALHFLWIQIELFVRVEWPEHTLNFHHRKRTHDKKYNVLTFLANLSRGKKCVIRTKRRWNAPH